MRPEDVGLSSDMAFFRARDVAQRNPAITHTTIYKSEKFSVSGSAKEHIQVEL
jgi:cysteamine dioxygenase